MDSSFLAEFVDGPFVLIRVGSPARPGDFEMHSLHNELLARFRQERPSGGVAIFTSFGLWGLFRYEDALEDRSGRAVLSLVRPKRRAFVQVSEAGGPPLGRIVLGRRVDGHVVEALDPEGRKLCSAYQKMGPIFHEVTHTIIDESGRSIAEVVPDVTPRRHGHVSRYNVLPSALVGPANVWVVLSWLPALALIDPKHH